MEQVCAKRVYDSWQQVERMLRQTRDRGMKVTLPKVTIQRAVGEATSTEEDTE